MLAGKAIFRSDPDGSQEKATQSAGKKAVQTVCNAYENGFLCVGRKKPPHGAFHGTAVI